MAAMAFGDLGLPGDQQPRQPLLVFRSPERTLRIDVDQRLPGLIEDLGVACLPERQRLDGFNEARARESDHSEKDSL